MKTSLVQFLLSLRCNLVAGAVAVLACSAVAQTTGPWKFMVVGDTRGTGTSDQINTVVLGELANEILAQQPKFVLVPGDLVYQGNLAAFQAWKQIMTPVYQASIGVFPVIGNHDNSDPASFIQVFGPDLPDNGPTGEINRTYAFSYDNTLVVGLDTYVRANRVNVPWTQTLLANNSYTHVFSFGHVPAFKANHTDCLDDYATDRDAFWNTLRNARSRVYFCGHDHFYDHMRVGDGDADPDNDVHQMIVGGGGAPLTGGYAYNGDNTTWSPLPVYHDMQYGYTIVTIDGPTATMTYYHKTGANTYVATSETWSYTVNPGPNPLPAPTGLAAAPGDGKVSLSWQALTDASGYYLKRAQDSPGGTWSLIATVTSPGYVDTDVVNGTTYYYAVSAFNDAGEGASSAYVSAIPNPPPSVPPAPLNLTWTWRRGQTKLSWSASPGATSYLVKRATTIGGPFNVLKRVTGTTYSDNKAPSPGTYYYVVAGANAAGEGPASDVAVVTTSQSSGRR